MLLICSWHHEVAGREAGKGDVKVLSFFLRKTRLFLRSVIQDSSGITDDFRADLIHRLPYHLLKGTIGMSNIKWDENQASPATAEALKYGRRLSDRILIAFHQACDNRDVHTAGDLLDTLGRLIARPVLIERHDRRKIAETQADANYRLWDLKRQQSSAPSIDCPTAELTARSDVA